MAVSDLLLGLGGAMNGYVQGQNMAQDRATKKAQADNERAKTGAELANQGLTTDANGNVINDPSFAPGNPSYERAMNLAAVKQAGTRGFIPEDQRIPLRADWALHHGGSPLPDTLTEFGDMKVTPGQSANYKPSSAEMNPNNQPANDALLRAQEQQMGLPAGSLNGTTQGKAAGGSFNIAGQEAAGNRAVQAQGAEATRQQTGIDAALAKQQDEQAYKTTMETGQHSSGQKTMDTTFAKDYAGYMANGGQAKAKADMGTIQNQINKLKTYDPGITGRAAGFLGNSAQDAVDPDLAAIRDRTFSAFTSSAKENFPGKMSTSEFNNYLKTKWNPRLGPAENAARMQDELDKMKSIDTERQKAGSYFRSKGSTLYGYQPSVDANGEAMPADQGDDPDLKDDGKPVLNPSEVRAAQAKKGNVAVNGGGISKSTVAAMAQMPTKGTLSAPKEGAFKKTPDGTNWKRTGGKWVEVMPGEPTE